jgi:FAD/FMN-containing dehydrogenase
MATSGYGEVLPVDGGVVVDFYRMRRILEIGSRNLTATVEPGLIWGHLSAWRRRLAEERG